MTELENTGSIESGAPVESGAEKENSGGLLQLVILVFSDPVKAFTILAARPRWIGAFLMVMTVSMAGTQATYPLIMEMQRDMYEQRVQGQQLTPEQEEMARQRLTQPDSPVMRIVSVVLQAIGQLLWLVIMAGILMFGGNIMLGGEATFKTLLSITAFSWLVLIPKTLLTVPLMLAKGSAAVSTSLQILIPSDRWMSPLGAALGAVDIFSIWMIALIVTGISITYRFSRAKAATLVISLYLLMVLIGVGLASVFSGMMG